MPKPKQARHKKFMLVRYGKMNSLGIFGHNESEIPKLPTRIVVKTNNGLELGHLVGYNHPYKGGHFKLDGEQLQTYYENSEIDFTSKPTGRVIRIATETDINEEKHLAKIAKQEMEHCKKLAKEMNLKMDVVDVEHIFGGERIIFYFMAENRVDFRELVKRITDAIVEIAQTKAENVRIYFHDIPPFNLGQSGMLRVDQKEKKG